MLLTEIAEYTYDKKEAILTIKMLENVQLNKENIPRHFNAIWDITSGTKYLALIDATNYYMMDEDAIHYAGLPKAIGKRIAVAHYTPILSTRLLAHYFIHQRKPPIPIQAFGEKQAAWTWLKQEKIRLGV